MTQQFDVLAVGELCPDFVLSGLSAPAPVLGTEQQVGAYQLVLGSATALCAVALARLGLRTAMVARVGADEYGRFCLTRLAEEGVDVSAVIMQEGAPTGLTVSVAYPTDRLLLTALGTMALLTTADVPDAMLGQARHLHVSTFYLQAGLQPGLPALLAAARRRGMTTSLDTGWDPAERWLVPELRAALEETDIFLPNESELVALGGTSDLDRAAASLHAAGAHRIVVKRGPAGATLYDGTSRLDVPGFAAVPLDTTGAGDNFNGGYLFGHLAGWPAARCLRLGNACGALSVATAGGVGGFTDLAEVERFAFTAPA